MAEMPTDEEMKAWREKWEADAKAQRERLEAQAEEARQARQAKARENDRHSGRNRKKK